MKTNQDNAISGIPLGYKATAFRCPKKAELFADDDGDGKVLIYRATGDHKNICKLIVEQVAVDDFEWVKVEKRHEGVSSSVRIVSSAAVPDFPATILHVADNGTAFYSNLASGETGILGTCAVIRESVTIMPPVDINEKPGLDPDVICVRKAYPPDGGVVLANMGGQWRRAKYLEEWFMSCAPDGSTEIGKPDVMSYDWDKANQPEYWKHLP